MQIEQQVPIMHSAVKTYVQEMGITDTFFERMFNTDPSEMKVYRYDYSDIVPHTDPVYDEIQTAQRAQQYGLTTSEYRKRFLAQLSRNCDTLDCSHSIMWGLSLEVYQSRAAVMKKRCGESLSDSEKQVLSATPQRDRHSLPFVARFIACRVNAMSGR